MSARRLYIVPADSDPTEFVDAATAEECNEIVSGVPAALAGIVDPDDLPLVHVEEVPETEPSGPTLDDLRTSIEELPDLTEPVRTAFLAALDAIEAAS